MKQVDVVGAVIRNAQGQILCARRSPNMSQGGLWEFPGGKVEPGEDPKETLRREIREELQCEIAVGDLIADATHAYSNIIVRLITYKAYIVAGEPQPTEHDQIRWLLPEALGALEWAPADLPTVAALHA